MPALAMADAAPREPGAPMGADDLDPELIRLRRPAPKVGIITAAGIVALCAIAMVRLRHDFAFSRAGDAPRSVTAEAIAKGELAEESYVTLAASAELAGALRLRVTEGSRGNRLVPVRGSSDRVWLALPGEDWEHFQHDDRVTGRLRRLDSARMAGAVARGLREFPAPRFAAGAALRTARTGGATQLTLLDGTVLPIDATTEIELAVVDPGAAVVVAAKAGARATDAAWAEALAAAQLIAVGQAPLASTDELVRWEIRRPDAVASVQAALDGAELWGARVEPSSTRLRAPWGQLATDAVGVTGPAGVIPWAAIDVAAVWAPRSLPEGAWVVLADERPGDYWYLTMVYVALALIGLLALWALARAIRRTFQDGAIAGAR